MIPKIVQEYNLEIVEGKIPSKTYRLSEEMGRTIGHVDGIDAVIQSIYRILNTERYKYLIYSWNYGVELIDLFGEPMSYVVPELESRIKDALIVDERVTDVGDFDFEIKDKRVLNVTFKVHTVYGQAKIEKVVRV